jgi:histidinol dehydrogenase
MRVLDASDFAAWLQSSGARQADEAVRQAVRHIIEDVRARGDEAVSDHTRRLDGVEPDPVRVPARRLRTAWEATPAALRRALREAARNLRAYQKSVKPRLSSSMETRPGVRLTTRWRPLRRVMAYAPGGRAAYPSTVLMTVVPARVAGVDEIHVASPPQKDGLPSRLVLAAAHLAGADAVWAVGGAQAVAAFAVGTATYPRVDKIVGPGNAYVVEAKRQLFGTVGIDSLAGPSELGVIADETADADLVAWDLAAQAEHDPDARAFVLVPGRAYARRLEAAVRRVVAQSERGAILATSLEEHGAIVVAPSMKTRLELLERAAPEHVQLMVRRPADYRDRLRGAGTVFEGTTTPAPLGDYVTGADHVLPTGGSARWAGPLGVHDFLKPVVLQRVTRAGLRRVGPHAVTIARAEGLEAHAQSVQRRLDA